MGCPSCGAENLAGARFCNSCGAPQAAVCLGCGNANPPGSRFCNACGTPLGAPAPPRQGAATSPQSYTPRHLAERILAGRAGLEGERKHVTVLFADVVGSTELIQGRDPEEAQAILDGVVRVMMDAVHRYEGTVSRLMGDGLMAMFGAPVAHEDHAVRACYAALAMQDAVQRRAARARQTHGVEIESRVGLNSGEVIVRLIRDDLHMDYTAMGQTVHLAARMEQLARPGSIQVTAETWRLAEGYIRVASRGPLAVKGLAAPIAVYELVGAEQARTRLQVSASRGLTRFVGRTSELRTIQLALAEAQQGHGQLVAVVGEPGVGKSRLVREVTQAQRPTAWAVLEASSVSYGRATSYLPVIDLLKAYFRIEPRDDARAISDRVAAKLDSLDPSLGSVAPAILALLEVPANDPAWDALDPPQRRQQTLDGIKRVLLRESQGRPLLLVFEDLHWIDGETQALLDSLVESLPTARLLLLVNYRPEYRHEWSNRSYYTQLRISALSAGNADKLLASLLGDAAPLVPLKRVLIEATEGNPLFLEECVRALVEAGTLDGERGAYRLTKPVDTVRVPATVQVVLAARIDRLEPEAKRLLQAAAVIGKDVPYSLLRAIADQSEEALRRGLTGLQTAEFLYEARLFPELEYTFKHALTHEVAYGSLLQERRRATHARVVQAIERLSPDRLAEEVERLAHHALRGEDWEKALAYARQAGGKAASRSAHREAVAWFDQALSALRHLPETREAREQAIDIQLDIRSSLYPLGEFAQIVERLREASGVAEALGDQGRLARIACYLASCFYTTASHDLAVESARRALAIAEAGGDLGVRLLANHYLGLAYHGLGAYRSAVDHLNRNVDVLRGDLLHEHFGMHGVLSVFSRSPLIWSLGELGEFAEAAARDSESVRIAEAAQHPYTFGAVCMGASMLHVRNGDVDSALALGEHGLELCRTWGLPNVFVHVATQMGYAHALAGRAADGLPLLTQALAQTEALGALHHHALWVGWLAEAYLLAGRMSDARDAWMRALDLSCRRNQRGCEAWALRLGGELASRHDPPDAEQARVHYTEALVIAEQLGMRPLQAHCHLGLGKLYRRTGRLDEAHAELATAVAMLTEMGMAFWLPEAERELAGATG